MTRRRLAQPRRCGVRGRRGAWLVLVLLDFEPDPVRLLLIVALLVAVGHLLAPRSAPPSPVRLWAIDVDESARPAGRTAAARSWCGCWPSTWSPVTPTALLTGSPTSPTGGSCSGTACVRETTRSAPPSCSGRS